MMKWTRAVLLLVVAVVGATSVAASTTVDSIQRAMMVQGVRDIKVPPTPAVRMVMKPFPEHLQPDSEEFRFATAPSEACPPGRECPVNGWVCCPHAEACCPPNNVCIEKKDKDSNNTLPTCHLDPEAALKQLNKTETEHRQQTSACRLYEENQKKQEQEHKSKEGSHEEDVKKHGGKFESTRKRNEKALEHKWKKHRWDLHDKGLKHKDKLHKAKIEEATRKRRAKREAAKKEHARKRKRSAERKKKARANERAAKKKQREARKKKHAKEQAYKAKKAKEFKLPKGFVATGKKLLKESRKDLAAASHARTGDATGMISFDFYPKSMAANQVLVAPRTKSLKLAAGTVTTSSKGSLRIWNGLKWGTLARAGSFKAKRSNSVVLKFYPGTSVSATVNGKAQPDQHDVPYTYGDVKHVLWGESMIKSMGKPFEGGIKASSHAVRKYSHSTMSLRTTDKRVCGAAVPANAATLKVPSKLSFQVYLDSTKVDTRILAVTSSKSKNSLALRVGPTETLQIGTTKWHTISAKHGLKARKWHDIVLEFKKGGIVGGTVDGKPFKDAETHTTGWSAADDMMFGAAHKRHAGHCLIGYVKNVQVSALAAEESKSMKGLCAFSGGKCPKGFKAYAGARVSYHNAVKSPFKAAGGSGDWLWTAPTLCCAEKGVEGPENLYLMRKACTSGSKKGPVIGMGVGKTHKAKAPFKTAAAMKGQKAYVWMHPSVCRVKTEAEMTKNEYCMFASKCPKGWTSAGPAALMFNSQAEAQAAPFKFANKVTYKDHGTKHFTLPELCCAA